MTSHDEPQLGDVVDPDDIIRLTPAEPDELATAVAAIDRPDDPHAWPEHIRRSVQNLGTREVMDVPLWTLPIDIACETGIDVQLVTSALYFLHSRGYANKHDTNPPTRFRITPEGRQLRRRL